MPKYRIEDMKVKATPKEIVEAYKTVMKQDDLLGELLPVIVSYLPYEYAKPYLKEWVTKEKFGQPRGDEDLQEDFHHYRDWWRQKVVNERGISCVRGEAQFLLRMMIAGLPEWREIWESDGGPYQRDNYNRVAELFGFERV